MYGREVLAFIFSDYLKVFGMDLSRVSSGVIKKEKGEKKEHWVVLRLMGF